MATPLYQRYVPGASIGKATVNQGPTTYKETQSSQGDHNSTRKRKHDTTDEKLERKARRLRDNLAGSGEEVKELDNTVVQEQDEEGEGAQVERTGHFAHIKSTKKRHKLEKEARKARKEAEKTGDPPAVDYTDTNQVVYQSSPALRTSSPPLHPPSPAPSQQQQHFKHDDHESSNGEASDPVTNTKRKHKTTAVDEAGDDDARLDKHAAIMSKFGKAQRRAKQTVQAALENNTEETEDDELPLAKTIIDPLIPIEVDTNVQLDEPSFSALPSWITSAQRIVSTSATSFDSLQLEKSCLRRLDNLGFSTALPVQQALIPLLLPPGVAGSQFASGTESVLPDIAVSAPTGSGKTLSYLLPLVESLKLNRSPDHQLRGLIVVPTRELVAQVAQLAESLTKGSGLTVGTASGAGRLKDEQQRLITAEHVYDPTAYRTLLKLAHLRTYPPSEHSAGFDNYIKTIDKLSDSTQRQIDDIARCPTDHILKHQSTIDIFVCTPGRLLEHLDNTEGFDLAHVSWLVLDEADKLLDEQYNGFLDRLHDELQTPRTEHQQDYREKFLRQNGLWDEDVERRVRKVVLSATMTKDVSQLASLRLRSPKLVLIGSQEGESATMAVTDNNTIKDDAQVFELPVTLKEFCTPVGDGTEKPLHLVRLLEDRVLGSMHVNSSAGFTTEPDSISSTSSDTESSLSSSTASMTDKSASSKSQATILVFAASNEAALRLSHLLKQLRPQWAAQITCLTKVSTASSITTRMKLDDPCIVIATDRAGRGLDTISGRQITHVVQYDVPRSAVSYVHRVGRTARAGRPGQAWTLFTKTEARWFINDITKTPHIKRASPVERVRFIVDDEEQLELYKEALANMRDIVFNSSRRDAP